MKQTERRLRLDDREIVYLLTRKPVKNINLRVREDGTVSVSAHPRVPITVIEGFLREKSGLLLGALARFAERQVPEEDRVEDGGVIHLWGEAVPLRVVSGDGNRLVYEDGGLVLTAIDPLDTEALRRQAARWKREECHRTVERLCRAHYPVFEALGVPFPQIRFRRMRARWGSCMPGRAVMTFNEALIEAPVACAEYVVVHELTHFLEPNHSARFYAWLDRLLPGWKERKKRLDGVALRK